MGNLQGPKVLLFSRLGLFELRDRLAKVVYFCSVVFGLIISLNLFVGGGVVEGLLYMSLGKKCLK